MPIYDNNLKYSRVFIVRQGRLNNNMDENSLINIINRCKQGQNEAFMQLLGEYGPRLYRYYVRSSNSQSEAEDLLQDLFVKLLTNIKDYKHNGLFEHWLFRVAANLARDKARKKKHRTFSLQTNNPNDVDIIDNIMINDIEPETNMIKLEQRDTLDKALEKLDSLDREIIILRHYGGLSFKEISEHFEIPINTALTKVHRGLKKLREILEYETAR